jgi:uncharacterized membrane protein YedE/YeeE
MQQDWVNALIGGVLIGVSVSLMLYWNGRVTGISGILSGILTPMKGDTAWRVLFVAGLVLGGFTVHHLQPGAIANSLSLSHGMTVIAGLLVGFGTLMGSGCTSGHGVCGISRSSPRSLVATLVFMVAGIASVYVFKKMGVL